VRDLDNDVPKRRYFEPLLAACSIFHSTSSIVDAYALAAF
jgi:hypothetical protein